MTVQKWRCGYCGQTYENYSDSVVCIKLHQREESEAKCLGYLTLRETLEKARKECGHAADLGNQIKEKILGWPADFYNDKPKRLQ